LLLLLSERTGSFSNGKPVKVFGWWCLFLSVQTFFAFLFFYQHDDTPHQKYYLDRIIPPPASESNIGIYAHKTLHSFCIRGGFGLCMIFHTRSSTPCASTPARFALTRLQFQSPIHANNSPGVLPPRTRRCYKSRRSVPVLSQAIL
jgi:hypothetical protein